MMLLPLYLLCLGLTLLCVLWACVRIARSSPVMAVLCFVFFPLALVHLVRHWGEGDDDIRMPFFAAIAFSLLAFYASTRLMVWATRTMEAQEALISTMQMQAGFDEDADGESVAINRSIAVAAKAGVVGFVGGRVPLPDAHAHLEVPEHFRFARADQLTEVAQAMGRGVLPGTQGWLLHDKVALADRDLWMVEVRWFPLGHVAIEQPVLAKPATLVAAREQLMASDKLTTVAASEWLGFLYQPEYERSTGALTWSEHSIYEPHRRELVDCYADLPGRNGVLRYSVEFLDPARAELGFRATRLLASRTRFDQDWTHADHSWLWDKNSGRRLDDLVTGLAFAD